ncbi:hypothetical protein ILYODFUR_022473 [Ilyodon furcidens]|uniref:Uncharacterized protein n=1 Tax=Ilyodon furcidens TaxID=33524 RepID=A0ABV0TWT6_9TELE
MWQNWSSQLCAEYSTTLEKNSLSTKQPKREIGPSGVGGCLRGLTEKGEEDQKYSSSFHQHTLSSSHSTVSVWQRRMRQSKRLKELLNTFWW